MRPKDAFPDSCVFAPGTRVIRRIFTLENLQCVYALRLFLPENPGAFRTPKYIVCNFCAPSDLRTRTWPSIGTNHNHNHNRDNDNDHNHYYHTHNHSGADADAAQTFNVILIQYASKYYFITVFSFFCMLVNIFLIMFSAS
jgi:hypothetical protein